MSSSDPNSKIVFTDTIETITPKIMKAFCCDGDANCGLMKLMKCVFFPLISEIIVKLDNGSSVTYTAYEKFEEDFEMNVFVAVHLKHTVIQMIAQTIEPITKFLNTDNMQKLVANAYP